MVDDLPLAESPRPGPASLALLVGRLTTLKLTYWFAQTAAELALPRFVAAPFAERFPFSLGAAVTLTVIGLVWAHRAARTVDARAGRLERSTTSVLVAFVTTSVVASPASIPLLLLERQRSVEGCVPQGTCHLEAIVLWVAMFAIGMMLIPLVFAASLKKRDTLLT